LVIKICEGLADMVGASEEDGAGRFI